MDLHYRKITINDLDQVDNLIVHQLFMREPLAIAFGINDPTWYESWMRKLTLPRVEEQQVSFGCFHGEKLVGILLNVVDYKDADKNLISLDTLTRNYAPHKSYPVVDIIIAELHKKIDLFGDLEAIFHLDLAAVDENYGCLGIATKLLDLSLKEGSSLGLKGAFAESTGKYSGKMLAKRNFERLITLKYKDYELTKNKDLGDHDELVIWKKII